MSHDGGRTNEEGDLRRESERIAQLIEDLGAMAGAPVRQRAEELVSRLVHLYGEGLRRLMQIVERAGETGAGDDRLRARLRDDALLSSLLVLHDLHPDPGAAAEWDPGPEPAPAHVSPFTPSHAAAAPAASGLVQIDLGRSAGARRRDGEG